MIDRDICIKAWKKLIAPPLLIPEGRRDFPTHESALIEILIEENYLRWCSIMIVLLEHYFSKPVKGRPQKPPFEIVSSGKRIKIRHIEKPEKKNPGRPKQSTLQEKKDCLQKLDALKQQNKIKTDKDIIQKMVDRIYKDLSTHKRQALTAVIHSKIKYFRDETLMRQKKRKTSL